MPTESEALVTEYRRGMNKKLQSKDQSRDRSRDKFRRRSRTNKDVERYYCQMKNHIKRECRKLKREQQKDGDAINAAATTFDGDEVIFLCDVSHFNLTSQDTC